MAFCSFEFRSTSQSSADTPIAGPSTQVLLCTELLGSIGTAGRGLQVLVSLRARVVPERQEKELLA